MEKVDLDYLRVWCRRIISELHTWGRWQLSGSVGWCVGSWRYVDVVVVGGGGSRWSRFWTWGKADPWGRTWTQTGVLVLELWRRACSEGTAMWGTLAYSTREMVREEGEEVRLLDIWTINLMLLTHNVNNLLFTVSEVSKKPQFSHLKTLNALKNAQRNHFFVESSFMP